MKPLMPPIDTPDQVFHDGDPSIGELGTICSAEWLNNVQGNIRNIQAECIAILKATGFTPDDTKDGQLWEAIQAAIKSQVPAASLTTAGITQLSSSVTSDSETIAATLKAVKIVMDNANARMAKDRNGADIPNKALFRQNLELGNSATLNTGTTAGTVAAGDDARILATQKAIDDTQTGLAIQNVMWISTADDLSNLPAGARRFATNNAGVTVLPAAGYFFLEVLAKRDTANGSCILATSDTRDVWIGFRYTVPDEAGFTWIQLNQNVENLGLKETVERATNAVQKNGDEMTGSLTLRSDDRMHFVIANADGSVRAFIYKDKGGDGIRINNGADGGGEFVLNRDGGFYAPSSLHIGNAWIANDGNIFGTRWDSSGAWLWEAIVGQLNTRSTIDYVNQTFVRDMRAGNVENTQVWRAYGYNDQAPYVITGVINSNTDDLIDNLTRRPLQKNINGVWYNIDFI